MATLPRVFRATKCFFHFCHAHHLPSPFEVAVLQIGVSLPCASEFMFAPLVRHAAVPGLCLVSMGYYSTQQFLLVAPAVDRAFPPAFAEFVESRAQHMLAATDEAHELGHAVLLERLAQMEQGTLNGRCAESRTTTSLLLGQGFVVENERQILQRLHGGTRTALVVFVKDTNA